MPAILIRLTRAAMANTSAIIQGRQRGSARTSIAVPASGVARARLACTHSSATRKQAGTTTMVANTTTARAG